MTMNSYVRSSARFIVAVSLAALLAAGCKKQPPQTVTVLVDKSAVHAPIATKHIYSETANPTADIAAALQQASAQHKRVILDFGGDWCGDCQVLDINFHKPINAQLLDKDFILVHIDIGHMDKNVDIATKYGVPLQKGVPALAVLDANGKLLYSQKTGEFEDMRNMAPESVTEFLNRWKA